eukprot:Sspe_Gene.39987::Locus_19279_Transcript_1_1_Confidence_1.000_Length_2158::g.39987::m.39987
MVSLLYDAQLLSVLDKDAANMRTAYLPLITSHVSGDVPKAKLNMLKMVDRIATMLPVLLLFIAVSGVLCLAAGIQLRKEEKRAERAEGVALGKHCENSQEAEY